MPQKGCISFDSYIKPQRCVNHVLIDFVVYLLFPTSNHNDCSLVFSACLLYIFCFLHQTTTLRGVESEEAGCISFVSYIKPQPDGKRMHSPHRCISFVSYIKPQPCNLVPISATGCISFVSYIKPQLRCRSLGSHRVVYLLFPTSNHNPRSCAWRCFRLYIFCFLHQTTTLVLLCLLPLSCISFVSYIKPQLIDRTKRTNKVVYLLFPTSNHNAIQCA